MTLTPTELQLIGGGVIFATALGSYWFFKRRSDRAAANINKTDQHSDQFDKIMEALSEDEGKKRSGVDRRKGPEQRRSVQRPMPGSSHEPARSRDAAIREAMQREPLERFGADPKPRLKPDQRHAANLRYEHEQDLRRRRDQEEELNRRRRQQESDSNLAATMATIQLTSSDDGGRSPGPTHSDNDSFKSGGGSFGGAGASSSWGGDSSSSSCSSSSSDSGGSCSSSD